MTSPARARDAGAWVHVDGAFGCGRPRRPRIAHLAQAFELADSWATDAHKWLNVPLRQRHRVRARTAAPARGDGGRAAYLVPDGRQRDPSQFTPELSRRARGVEGLGRAALARPARAGRVSSSAPAATRARFADGLRDGRLRDPERRGRSTRCSCRSATPDCTRASIAARSAGRHLLVRRHRVAGPHRHAHQRVVVGDDR